MGAVEPGFFRLSNLGTNLVWETTYWPSKSINPVMGVWTSFRTTLTAILPTAPSIISQPVGQTNVIGATNVILSVGATGTFLSYQWYSNAVRVAGATGPSYTVPSPKTNSADYFVVVSNVLGVATSSVVGWRLQWIHFRQR